MQAMRSPSMPSSLAAWMLEAGKCVTRMTKWQLVRTQIQLALRLLQSWTGPIQSKSANQGELHRTTDRQELLQQVRGIVAPV